MPGPTAYTNAAEHLRYATFVTVRDNDTQSFHEFIQAVPNAAREMPLHLLPAPIHLASVANATGANATEADKQAMLRVMTDHRARESPYTLTWFCAASKLGEESITLGEFAGVYTLAQLYTFHQLCKFHDIKKRLHDLPRDRQDRLFALCEVVSQMFALYEAEVA